MRELEFLDFIPPLDISEALAIQSLAMSEVRSRARTVRQGDRMTRFVLYDAIRPGQEALSDGVECFLGVCVGKVALNNWTMRISFLELELAEGMLYSNKRELYRFDWDAKGNCFGGKSLFMNNYDIIGRDFNEVGNMIDTIEEQRMKVDSFVEVPDCDELTNRMLEVSRRMSEKSSTVRLLP